MSATQQSERGVAGHAVVAGAVWDPGWGPYASWDTWGGGTKRNTVKGYPGVLCKLNAKHLKQIASLWEIISHRLTKNDLKAIAGL